MAGERIRPATVVVTVMASVLTIGVGLLIASSLSAHGKAVEASEAVIRHNGAAESHPTIQAKADANYRVIQEQLKAIGEKLDAALDDG